MRKTYLGVRRSALAALLLCGCQSLPNPPALLSGQPYVEVSRLSKDQIRLSDALSHYSLGMIHELNREFDEAMEQYLLAAKREPDHEPLQLEVTRRLLRMQRPEDAAALIESYVKRHPRSEKGRIWQALVYQANLQPERAREVYAALVEERTSDAIPYIELASIYLREGNSEKAEETLHKGTRYADSKLEIYRILGQYYTDTLPRLPIEATYGERLGLAIEAYRSALEIEPDDITLLYRLGDLHILERNIEDAIEVFQRIEQLRPDDLQIKQRLAFSFLEIGDTAKAIRSLEAFVENDPTNGAVLYYLGELYQQEGDIERAKLNFSLASRLIDNDPAPFLRLAILDIDEAPERSVEVLREGLEKMPDDERLTEILAYALLEAGELDEALDLFHRIETSPDQPQLSPSFRFNYALGLYRAGRREKAATRLAGAMQDNLDYLRRFINTMLVDPDESLEGPIEVLRKLLTHHPEEPSVFLYLALLTHYQGEHQDALPYFEATLELAEEDPRRRLLLDDRFYFAYGAALERTEAYEQAAETFLKAIELNPDNANAHNYLAYMWAERGENLDQALEHVLIALEFEPDSAAFIDTLGWIYYMQGHYDKALVEIERAVELLPDDPILQDHLGDVKYKLDREEEAVVHWQRSFELDRENEEVREKLVARGITLEDDEAEEEQKEEGEKEEPGDQDDEPTLQKEAPSESAATEEPSWKDETANDVESNDDYVPPREDLSWISD